MMPKDTIASLAAPGHDWHELLESLAVGYLARIDVPLRVHPDRVDKAELAGVPAIAAEGSERLAGGVLEDPDLVVRAVGHIHEFLFGVSREDHLVRGSASRPLAAASLAASRCVGRHGVILHPLALLRVDGDA